MIKESKFLKMNSNLLNLERLYMLPKVYNTKLIYKRNNILGEDFDRNGSLAQYQLVSKLGEGGFGKVMLAKHKQTGKKVAIKFVNTQLISNHILLFLFINLKGNTEEIDMVFREAELLKSLEHKNIVRLFNCLSLKTK